MFILAFVSSDSKPRYPVAKIKTAALVVNKIANNSLKIKSVARRGGEHPLRLLKNNVYLNIQVDNYLAMVICSFFKMIKI